MIFNILELETIQKESKEKNVPELRNTFSFSFHNNSFKEKS